MSMFLASCRRADDERKLPTLASGKSKGVNKNKKGLLGLVCGFVAMVWFSLVFGVEFVLRCLWVCDRKTEISGGDGVELWPRKLATAKFRLQDMKHVKKAIPNAVSSCVFCHVCLKSVLLFWVSSILSFLFWVSSIFLFQKKQIVGL